MKTPEVSEFYCLNVVKKMIESPNWPKKFAVAVFYLSIWAIKIIQTLTIIYSACQVIARAQQYQNWNNGKYTTWMRTLTY